MTADDGDDGLPFYHPERKAPAPRRVLTPGEYVWQLQRDHVTWSAELVFRGESYGWECRVLRDSELAISQRFITRAIAETWAAMQRADVERGWTD